MKHFFVVGDLQILLKTQEDREISAEICGCRKTLFCIVGSADFTLIWIFILLVWKHTHLQNSLQKAKGQIADSLLAQAQLTAAGPGLR